MVAEPREGLPSGTTKSSGPLSERREEWEKDGRGGWHMKLSVFEGEWAQSRTPALIVPLLQLGLPGGNIACGGVRMATSSWEMLPCPSRPVSNATSLEKPQPPSEHLFPSYIVICVRTVVW